MKQRSRPASLSAPIGGWNARDALGEMNPTDAVYLTNWFPGTSDVGLRNGYLQHATGLGAQVETLAKYSGGTTNKFFAFAGSNVYEVTSSGAVGAAVVTGLSNARWQYTNISTPGGNFLIAFNGVDVGLRYNGTTWVSIPNSTGKTISSLTGNGATSTVTTATAHGLRTGNTVTVTGASVAGFNVSTVSITVTGTTTFTYASTGTPSATGASYTVGEGISIDPTGVIGVTLFKNRLWLTPTTTLSPFYLGTNSVAGTATQFPLQSIARLGGYVMAIATWTFDGGYGMDDMLAFVTSEGEVIVYNGLDPAQSQTWQLSGVWVVGRPVGRRCLYKYAGDLLLLCQDGLLPLSTGLQSSQVNPQVALSNKIMYAMSTAISTYATTYGWQTIYLPKQNALIVNVPVSVGSQQQYVMNTITKAWCNFTGWASNCFEVFNDELYFGGNGFVAKAWVNNDDAGSNIEADGKQAFNYFGSPGTYKRWTMMRPIVATNGSPGLLAALNIDFDDGPITSPVSYSPAASGTWNTGVWDQAVWGGGNTIQKQWQGVTGVGYCAAVRLKSVSQGIDVHWVSTDLVMEPGSIL